MSNAPFSNDPIRTAIAIAYTNRSFVSDKVLPRVTVGAPEFKYTIYNKEDRFTLQETMVGRKGRVNEVEFGGSDATAMVADYGLEDPIPNADIALAAQSGYDVKGNSTEILTELLLLDRERRVATIVQDGNNHGSKETLAGTDQWSDPTSDVITQVSDALEVPMMRPNVLVISSPVKLALARHPQMLKAYHGNLGDTGMVPLSFIAALFELDEIVVGEAKINVANPGQAMDLQGLWGNHATFLYRNPLATPRKGVTFGFTAEFGGRVAQSRPDADIGLRGGERMRVGETVKELVIANDVSYQFRDAI